MDGLIVKLMNEWMGCVGWMDGMYGWTDGIMDGWRIRCINGGMDGWLHEWMDGWMKGLLDT